MQNPEFHKMAVEAFEGYIRALEVRKLKHIFNVISMDMDKVAKSFGLKKKPDVDIRKCYLWKSFDNYISQEVTFFIGRVI